MTTMGNNTATIYLRRSTEDNGTSAAQQERELRTKAGQLVVNAVSVYCKGSRTPTSSLIKRRRLYWFITTVVATIG